MLKKFLAANLIFAIVILSLPTVGIANGLEQNKRPKIGLVLGGVEREALLILEL
ncbi:hypothetical protein QUF74_06150 [Candidatus Halobeggiatoa sp. HSG11]|nr:hypothetical protein [Candidatus Halobeggiatoa sp. HSG11]